jgi:hypothetical protein
MTAGGLKIEEKNLELLMEASILSAKESSFVRIQVQQKDQHLFKLNPYFKAKF